MSSDPVADAERYAKAMLAALPGAVPKHVRVAAVDSVAEWAASGLMALTGPTDGAPVAITNPIIANAKATLAAAEAVAGRPTGLDAAALLSERAALRGLRRRGSISPGGGSRMLPTADGVIAISLVREADWDAVPAWLGQVADDWPSVEALVGVRPTDELADRARLLGLPYATPGRTIVGPPARATRCGDAPPRPLAGLRVVDLSAMWAGPLCGRLLASLGADVTKVEAASRPDALRDGEPELWERLNRDKKPRTVEWRQEEVARLVAGADVVIEAARPRVMAQLGIDVVEIVEEGTTWVSISGHGRRLAPDRVAFGDDAAVAGGAFVRTGGVPWFVGDAIADPLAGIHAAAAAVAATTAGGAWLLDISMSGVVASVIGPHGVEVAERPVATSAAPHDASP